MWQWFPPRPWFLVQVEDFLNPRTELSGFHVCIDKGTFDAISLNPDRAAEKRKQYVGALSRVLGVKGFFLITSCNWTTEELLNEFREGNWLCCSSTCFLRLKAPDPAFRWCCSVSLSHSWELPAFLPLVTLVL